MGMKQGERSTVRSTVINSGSLSLSLFLRRGSDFLAFLFLHSADWGHNLLSHRCSFGGHSLHESWCFLFFSFGSSSYQLGCTIDAVSAQRPVAHVKNVLQKITSERTPQSVQCSCSGWPTGYGKKLSSTQAQLGQTTCLAFAEFLSISCGPSWARAL